MLLQSIFVLSIEIAVMVKTLKNLPLEDVESSQLLDYDDMLVRLYELLIINEAVADKISSKFKYIMIDECQDSNKLQNNIIKEVCKVHGNLMAVGDPNQSIYGFRGACFENMFTFYWKYLHKFKYLNL